MFGIEDFSQKIVDFQNFEIGQLWDALKFGGSILLIGMLTVFAVLTILWGGLALFKFFFHDLKFKTEGAEKKNTVAIAQTATVPEAVIDDYEIVAVIAAAIAMAESEGSDVKFKVVSFRRK